MATAHHHLPPAAAALLLLYRGATPPDRRVLPDRIILVRHAQSEGNVDAGTYTYIPDPQVPLVSLILQAIVRILYVAGVGPCFACWG